MATMDFRELKFLIRSDLHRYYGRSSAGLLARELLFGVGFKYSFWMRVTRYVSLRSRRWVPLSVICKLIMRRYAFKFGIAISHNVEIGSGFYIGHFGGIVVSHLARIGRDCNISQGVTIGQSSRGKRCGAPVIGDRVYIGPGAKLFGKVTIGNNVAIGANCVVTKDVPDNAVVVGVPGRVISFDGATGYVNRTDYGQPPAKKVSQASNALGPPPFNTEDESLARTKSCV